MEKNLTFRITRIKSIKNAENQIKLSFFSSRMTVLKILIFSTVKIYKEN